MSVPSHTPPPNPTPSNLNRAIRDTVTKSDRTSKTRTLYDASTQEIIWRNFLAGMSRGLGGIMIYLLFFFVIATFFLQFVWPHLEPFLSSYTSLVESVTSLNSFQPTVGVSPNQPVSPAMIDTIIDQFQAP